MLTRLIDEFGIRPRETARRWRHAEERRIGVSSTTCSMLCWQLLLHIVWWSDVEGLGLRLFLFVLGRRRHFELGIDDFRVSLLVARQRATAGGPRKRWTPAGAVGPWQPQRRKGSTEEAAHAPVPTTARWPLDPAELKGRPTLLKMLIRPPQAGSRLRVRRRHGRTQVLDESIKLDDLLKLSRLAREELGAPLPCST